MRNESVPEMNAKIGLMLSLSKYAGEPYFS